MTTDPGRCRITGCRCCGASPLVVRGPGKHAGRGLCSSCGRHAARTGTLTSWPRTTRTRAQVVREVREVRAIEPHLTVAQLADRLDMTYAALEMALRRARADGVPV